MSGYWTPSGQWMRRFRQTLALAFDEASLGLLTVDYFGPGRTFANLASPGPGRTFEVRIQELLDQARMDDWLLDLVAAAYERRPKNPDLAAIAEERGLTLAGPRIDNPTGTSLEALIEQNAKFINPTLFLERLSVLQGQICFVDVPKGGGTGFLVGKDVVVTNQHVIAPVVNHTVSSHDVKCRFDHKQGLDGAPLGEKSQTVIGLHTADWLVDSRPPSATDLDATLGDAGPHELDYAVIRLEEAVGKDPVGGATADPKAEPRGWIATDQLAPAVAGNQIFMLQHPNREPLQLAVGSVEEFNGTETRMRHTANSKDGSSGSPCFNADLELVALHHAHDPVYPPKWNQAVPFNLIRDVWKLA